MKHVKVFGPGCKRCETTEQMVTREFEHVEVRRVQAVLALWPGMEPVLFERQLQRG